MFHCTVTLILKANFSIFSLHCAYMNAVDHSARDLWQRGVGGWHWAELASHSWLTNEKLQRRDSTPPVEFVRIKAASSCCTIPPFLLPYPPAATLMLRIACLYPSLLPPKALRLSLSRPNEPPAWPALNAAIMCHAQKSWGCLLVLSKAWAIKQLFSACCLPWWHIQIAHIKIW